MSTRNRGLSASPLPAGTQFKCEPVWPSSKAGKQKDLGWIPLRLSFFLKICGLWTLSCGFVLHS